MFTCWWCGAKAPEIDTSTLSSAFSTSLPGRWSRPGVDHDHSITVPKPHELEQAGYALVQRRLADRQ